MKKGIIIFLLSAVILTAFAGCGDMGENSELNIYSEASFDNESKFVPDTESVEGAADQTETSQEPLVGEFVVKDKKYTYDGNDLVVVSVENKTNKNYAVTITGTYLDKDGNEIKSEVLTSDQYSAGYSNHFLFQPDLQFDKFVYEFETNEINGPFYAKDITFKFNGLEERKNHVMEQVEKGDYNIYPSILSSISLAYTGDTTIEVNTKWVLINEQEQVIAVFFKSVLIEPNEGFHSYFNNTLYYTLEGDLTWPEGWDGDIRAIPIFESVTDNPIVYH